MNQLISSSNGCVRIYFLRLVCVLALLLTIPTQAGFAQEIAIDEETRKLKDELNFFAPYVGVWECDAEWSGGGAFWARNEYSIGMNGNFFEAVTWTKNESGKLYQRYRTIWRIDPSTENLQSYGFTYDGTVMIAESEIDRSGDGHPIIRAKWRADETSPFIKQEVQMNEGEKSYQWRVWTSPDGEDWTNIMDTSYDKK